MASCQQYEMPICGDCKCWKRQEGQTVSVSCKAYPGQVLGIAGLVPSHSRLTLAAPSHPTQTWVKVDVGSTNNNDKQKLQSLPVPIPVPVFAFVNTSHGLTIRYDGDNVGLSANFDKGDKNEQWTESEDKGDGFKNIINADGNVWTAEDGEEGIKIMLRTASNQENQLWKIENILPPK